MLSIATTRVILHLSLLVPLAAAISIDFSNFDRETKLTCSPNQQGICLQGDAFFNQGLQLTKNQLHSSIASSVGRAVYSQPVHIWDSATGRMADFTTQFSFIIHDVDPGSPSGDGVAFFLSSYPSVIPDNSAGGFLGLFPNSSHSDGHGKVVAIEFDTYPNGDLDSGSADHIGVNVNSIRSVIDLTLEDGIKKRTVANARIQYNANRQTLNVTLSYDNVILEGNSDLSHVVDLSKELPEYASIGFSAATGSFVETHTILSWSFDSSLDVIGNGIPVVIMAGTLVVGIMLLWLLMWSWRKTVAMKVDNVSGYAVLPSEKNEEKKDKGEITGVDTMIREGTGQDLIKVEDNGLYDIALVQSGGRQTDVISSYSEPLIEEDKGREEEDITSYAECMEEDEHGISESKKTGEIVRPLEQGKGGTNFKDVGSDVNIVKKGGGSHLQAPIPVDLLDRWSPREFPYHVLLSATNNFSEEMTLGKGGFGPVYRGFLRELGLDVAIKRLSKRSQQGISEYMAEVKIITQLRHRNLVKLIGWCQERGELMLVYEFMPNGSLDVHLFKENDLLEWSVRYKIVLGLANALMYLHDECEPYVLHRDVKSSNVLLDAKFGAKLADFGLAKLFNLDISSLRLTHPAGTLGYWAPEYALTSRASRRSDVYSYGVVALEIACGRKAILVQQDEEEDVESSRTLLVEWVWDLYSKGAILDAADKRLNGNFDRLQMQRLLITGLWCAHPDYRQRPSIRQAGNALLYPETIPLPTLPARMPPWAFPLAPMQMVQTSPEPTLPKKTKRQLFARFAWRSKRNKATPSVETLDNEVRISTGLKEFSHSELVQATDNYSARLGEGGFSRVYKGQLASGVNVAIKRFSSQGESSKEYMTQVTTLSRLAHRNLVKLIGWCQGRGEYWLVYEYMANGTLEHHLYRNLAGIIVPWEARYKVVLSLASVLCYLHNDCELCVLHRDIKPHNMFLDEDFNMKLGGFALATQVDHGVSFSSTSIAGTMGYMAPECFQLLKYTTASDAYSFGVVALEIACGRWSLRRGSTLGYDFLLQWVWDCYANGSLLEASDERLKGNFDSREMERLMVVGLWCTQYDPAQRPQMRKVLGALLFEEEPPALVPSDGVVPAIGLSSSSPVSSTCDGGSDVDS